MTPDFITMIYNSFIKIFVPLLCHKNHKKCFDLFPSGLMWLKTFISIKIKILKRAVHGEYSLIFYDIIYQMLSTYADINNLLILSGCFDVFIIYSLSLDIYNGRSTYGVDQKSHRCKISHY